LQSPAVACHLLQSSAVFCGSQTDHFLPQVSKVAQQSYEDMPQQCYRNSVCLSFADIVLNRSHCLLVCRLPSAYPTMCY